MKKVTEKPLVSVIMPAYNAANTISESIESVLSQTYSNWELIIVDDGSLDQTKPISEQYAIKDSRIKVLPLSKNGGLPNARNQGILNACGTLIAFLDSDDLWHDTKLGVQVEFHQMNPTVLISHTDFVAFNASGVINRPFKWLTEPDKYKQGIIFPSVCYKNPIGILTVMLYKDLLVEVGKFDSSLWTLEDQDLWIRIAKKNIYFGYINKKLAYYRYNENSITHKIGKYKQAYKLFLKRIKYPEVDINLLFRQYYRHFGTVYFKKKKWTLSKLYFIKSIKLRPFDLVSSTTLIYLLIAQLYSLKDKYFNTIKRTV